MLLLLLLLVLLFQNVFQGAIFWLQWSFHLGGIFRTTVIQLSCNHGRFPSSFLIFCFWLPHIYHCLNPFTPKLVIQILLTIQDQMYGDVMRINSFHLSKLSNAKFSTVWYISLLRDWNRKLKLITSGSEKANCFWHLFNCTVIAICLFICFGFCSFCFSFLEVIFVLLLWTCS